MELLPDPEFWAIVEEIGWPRKDFDAVKLMLMRKYPPQTMEAMAASLRQKTAELARAAKVNWCCDSWDDTRNHIVGLGKRVYEEHLAHPALIVEREKRGDSVESFAYCLPFRGDYALLTDSGYRKYLSGVREFLADLDNADPDKVPPRLFGQFADARRVCNVLLQMKWSEAVAAYHQVYGTGYADRWPFADLCGFLIPNFVQSLERFRLADEQRGSVPD